MSDLSYRNSLHTSQHPISLKSLTGRDQRSQTSAENNVVLPPSEINQLSVFALPRNGK